MRSRTGKRLNILTAALGSLVLLAIPRIMPLLAAAEPPDLPASGAAPKQIRVIDDLAYRSGSSKAWRLDLAMPENFGEEKHPALVIVHGGGWRAGTKHDRPYRTLLLDYALKGYVTVSVEYRLTGEAPFPACIEDVKCAVRWLRAHAAEYHVDPDRIGAFGHSAGAHLVLMLAMCPASAGLEGDGGWSEFSSRVNAVVAASTPVRVRGTGADADRWSPTSYITNNLPPLLLIQGTKDEVVSPSTVDAFVDKLKQVEGLDVTYLQVTNGVHATAYDMYVETSRNAMERFYTRTLRVR
jgi:acetyl esterase/lipase